LSNKDEDDVPIEIKDDEISQTTFPETDFEEATKNSIDEETENIDDSIIDDSQTETSFEELKNLLVEERQKSKESEEKLKRMLADFQNLEKKSKSDIKNGINMLVDEFMVNFLIIYDDFNRAKDAYVENKINIDGLNSILKNMDLLLSKSNITPIDALGEIFDPKLHEAISVVEDSTLDDNTITKEIRKGYISQNRVIRPTLVEITKNSKIEKMDD